MTIKFEIAAENGSLRYVSLFIDGNKIGRDMNAISDQLSSVAGYLYKYHGDKRLSITVNSNGSTLFMVGNNDITEDATTYETIKPVIEEIAKYLTETFIQE